MPTDAMDSAHEYRNGQLKETKEKHGLTDMRNTSPAGDDADAIPEGQRYHIYARIVADVVVELPYGVRQLVSHTPWRVCPALRQPAQHPAKGRSASPLKGGLHTDHPGHRCPCTPDRSLRNMSTCKTSSSTL